MMTLPALMGSAWGILIAFVFLYPLLMSAVWSIGAITFYILYERHPHRIVNQPPLLADYPLVAILVPCFNEEANARETVVALMELQYPNFEVLMINDGSTDRTGEILNSLTVEFPRLRVIHNLKNQGKAVGLNTAAQLTKAEILVGIDGDARLDTWCLHWLVRHFAEARVGAVTGNPRVRTRSTLLGRIQVGEFSSMIGLIKRAQRSVGLVFTVSGVIAAFRRSALYDVGFWSPDKLTEDVDITWRLHLAGWEVRFEPRALCWILMPETFRGLWRQRLRWATGGLQVVYNYWGKLLRRPRLWMVFAEYFASMLWAISIAVLVFYRVLDLMLYNVDLHSVPILLIGWTGLVLGTVCLLENVLGILMDYPYDHGLVKNLFWMIWYPVIYWMVVSSTAVCALPALMMRKTGERAIWVSPDRGLTSDEIPGETLDK
jgi:biofilm PGA synthesis N-glycosyltransferase PgaC